MSRFEKGYSLPDALASITLTALLVMGLYQFTIGSQRIFMSQEEQMNMDQQARVAMDTMVRSIRRAGSDPMESAFDPNVTDSVLFPKAQQRSIRILADLPQDTMNDAGTAIADGDDFDSHDDGDGVWENNENENGDGMLLPANADTEEDIIFCLTPSDSNLVPTGSGPWTLVKRTPDGQGGHVDQPLASNVINATGNPGLEFRYIKKINSGNSNVDTLPLSFANRWNNVSGSALNVSSYTDQQDKRLISRVLIRFTVRSSNKDRTSNLYKYITLESDVDVRVQS